ncbi:MAG: hypothetical protein KAS22_13180, partial [Candidatus Heimdallarchaeota archaeon]|nr:hypothetical protein [Candidatus Heimdallarchaeota archaeon]
MSKEFYEYYKSPTGYIEIVSSDTSILKCNFVENKIMTRSKNMPLIMKVAKEQLDSYFNGTL